MSELRLIVREAKLLDAKNLLAVYKSILNTSRWVLSEPDEIAKNVKEEEVFIKQHKGRDNAILLVAEDCGSVVGILNAWGDIRRRRKHVVSIGISVLKEYRGRGVGTFLLKHLFKWARNKDIKKINLIVMKKNSEAIALYKKMGFSVEGMLKKEIKINNRYYDVVQMARFL